ncbi:MAG: hypothetical protein ACKOX6_11220 [Bdellovibrio sp.]
MSQRKKDTPTVIRNDLNKILKRTHKMLDVWEEKERGNFEASDKLSQLRYFKDQFHDLLETLDVLRPPRR